MRRRVVPSQAVIHGDILGHTRSRPDRYAPRNHLKIHPNDSLSVTNVRPDVFDQHVAAPTGAPRQWRAQPRAFGEGRGPPRANSAPDTTPIYTQHTVH